jgi:hypothetical protein
MTHRPLQSLALTVALALFLVVGTAHEHVQAQDEICFSETGFCISGRIREYWEQNGGLPVFGYPITAQQAETVEGQSVQVQWFERNRLELHPENERPYDVLLGRLGAGYLEQQGRNWFTFPTSQPRDGCRFFAETGHNVCGEFLNYWRSNGLEIDGRPGKTEAESLALFGLPLSDEQTETFDGKEYTVQWFERARFEFHPENQPPFNVLLGLLGNEMRATTGPPSAPAAPETPVGQIAFTSVREGNQDVYVMNTDGTGQRRLMNIPENDGQPTWSPDGTQIAFETDRDGNWEVYRVNVGGPVALTPLSKHGLDDGAPSWSWIPEGGWQIAFHSNRTGYWNIYTMNPTDGSQVRNLSETVRLDANSEDPALSPDGSRIAFMSTLDGNQELYVMNLDGSGIIRLTTNEAPDGKPVWSPDSQWIAFETRRDGNWEVYRIRADGSGGILNLTQNDASDGYPTWSPDGKQIAFQTNRSGNWDIYVLDVESLQPQQLTTDAADDLHPAWQP